MCDPLAMSCTGTYRLGHLEIEPAGEPYASNAIRLDQMFCKHTQMGRSGPGMVQSDGGIQLLDTGYRHLYRELYTAGQHHVAVFDARCHGNRLSLLWYTGFIASISHH